MIIYNVTVKVEHEIHEDWLEWMKSVHIPDVMATGLFSENRICRLLLEEEDGVTYAVQYSCEDMETLEEYQEKHAPRLQEKHSERYKNKFVAFRTLLKEV